MKSRILQPRVAILLCSHIFEKFPYSLLPAHRVRNLVSVTFTDRHCTGKILPSFRASKKFEIQHSSILRTDGPYYFLWTLYRQIMQTCNDLAP